MGLRRCALGSCCPGAPPFGGGLRGRVGGVCVGPAAVALRRRVTASVRWCCVVAGGVPGTGPWGQRRGIPRLPSVNRGLWHVTEHLLFLGICRAISLGARQRRAVRTRLSPKANGALPPLRLVQR